jgi:hypothetical protein
MEGHSNNLWIDNAVIIHPKGRHSHGAPFISINREVCPKCRTKNSDAINYNAFIHQKVHRSFVRSLAHPNDFFFNGETLFVSIPFVISGDVNDRLSTGYACKPWKRFAPWVMYITSRND